MARLTTKSAFISGLGTAAALGLACDLDSEFLAVKIGAISILNCAFGLIVGPEILGEGTSTMKA